ncbi:hypothetical protein MLD38_040742 [Melastoma candidum]|nr:hypothetical protein MLD38_040742 [Melastoma candidum]
MGSAMSSSFPVTGPSLGDLPENCIMTVLMFLDPPDICRLALVNKSFRSASSADAVWESKLPANYRLVVERVIGEDPDKLGKKEVYARICRGCCFDGGTKVAFLERFTGNFCISISYKALKITGINDRRYWTRIPTDESRFQTVAYLQQMWWLEVAGELDFHFQPGSYHVYFRLQLGKPWRRFGLRTCDVEQVHGWDLKPARFQLTTSDGQHTLSQCYLERKGTWDFYHAGGFVVENPRESLGIKFSMIQIDCTHIKSGLCLDSVIVSPNRL